MSVRLLGDISEKVCVREWQEIFMLIKLPFWVFNQFCTLLRFKTHFYPASLFKAEPIFVINILCSKQNQSAY